MNAKYLKYIFIISLSSIIFLSGCSESTNNKQNITRASIYPNPFSVKGMLILYLENENPVTITIADFYGREVKKLIDNEVFPSGNKIINIDMTFQSSGVYSCIINCSGEITIVNFSVYK